VEAAAVKLAEYAAAANASIDAAAAPATAGMAKVQMSPAQVQEQASPEAPPEPIAQVIQPEPAVKEKIPAGPIEIEAATLVALLNAMQLKTEQVLQGSLQIMDERLAIQRLRGKNGNNNVMSRTQLRR
jgi:hypothetical protein